MCSVLDELDHVGAVAHDAQRERAEGVGHEVRGALLKDAVAEQGTEHVRRPESTCSGRGGSTER